MIDRIRNVNKSIREAKAEEHQELLWIEAKVLQRTGIIVKHSGYVPGFEREQEPQCVLFAAPPETGKSLKTSMFQGQDEPTGRESF